MMAVRKSNAEIERRKAFCKDQYDQHQNTAYLGIYCELSWVLGKEEIVNHKWEQWKRDNPIEEPEITEPLDFDGWIAEKGLNDTRSAHDLYYEYMMKRYMELRGMV